MKALRVVVVFEYSNVPDVDGEEADKIVQLLTQSSSQMAEDYTATYVWIDDAVVVDTGVDQ
jgi:hypothetical protein